jgi:hypothetical protein
MPWSSLASNQAVSFNNLQDAVNTGVFLLRNTIPVSNECITKADADYYVYINASAISKASNQLVVKSDLTSYTTGIVFTPSSGLYPVSGTSSTTTGTLYNNNSYTIYFKGLFNSGGRNSGTVDNDNFYFNFPLYPSIPTQRLFFLGLSITSFGQNIYTNRNSDSIRAGWFDIPAGWYANITIDKFDGFGSGTTLRFAFSLTSTGTYITL